MVPVVANTAWTDAQGLPAAGWRFHQAPQCDIMSAEPQWFFYEQPVRGQSSWKKMTDARIIARLEEAVKNNEGRVAYDWLEDGEHYAHYVMDLVNMMQYNVTNQTARSILRVAGIPPHFADCGLAMHCV